MYCCLLSRPICGFLNSGKCGTVYVGIRSDGVVAGVRVDRKQVKHLISCQFVPSTWLKASHSTVNQSLSQSINQSIKLAQN